MFGFGGREVAGRELERWVRDVKARATVDRSDPPRHAPLGSVLGAASPVAPYVPPEGDPRGGPAQSPPG